MKQSTAMKKRIDHAERQRGRDDPLCEAPERFEETGDIGAFMEEITPWVMRYARRKLHYDQDVIADFYVHFYERAEECLKTYASRRSIPFTGFLASYLRHEFLNFIRPRRNFMVEEFTAADTFLLESNTALPFAEIDALDSLDPVGKLALRLEKIPIKLRLPLKLLHGMNLNREELRHLVEDGLGPDRVSCLLQTMRHRREQRQKEWVRLRNRSAHLNYLIHTQSKRSYLRSNPDAWRRWKERISCLLDRQTCVFTRAELARELQINRTTVSRRIDRAIELLKDGEV